MILDFWPDKPGAKTTKKFIGYWHDVKIGADGRWSPMHSFVGYEERLGVGVMPLPSDFVDHTWDETERALVVAYLRTGKTFESWRGFSACRFGCDHRAGKQGTTDLSDGTYVWPAGFAHYLECHGVRPPAEFIEHVKKAKP